MQHYFSAYEIKIKKIKNEGGGYNLFLQHYSSAYEIKIKNNNRGGCMLGVGGYPSVMCSPFW